MNARNFQPLPLALAALALLAAGPALATQSYTKSDTYKYPAIKSGGSLDLTNLVGHVDVVPADDGVLEVDSKIVAAADTDADAQALAGKIRVEAETHGNSVVLMTHYPLDEYDHYFYHGEDDNSFGFSSSNSSTTYDGEHVRISSGNFGSGVNLHVDYTVHVPQGIRVKVENKVGLIDAKGVVKAPLELDGGSGDIRGDHNSGGIDANTGSGDISFDHQDGPMELKSGSGDITVQDQKGGDLNTDTGSGDVKLDTVAGMVTARTGSGEVKLLQFTGGGADLETGSGGITVKGAGGSMKLRTGSGGIEVSDYKAGEALECHAGSGDISVSGDLSALLRLSAESGSGDIVLHTSGMPSLHIDASSDSGDLNIDLPGMQNVSMRHHSFRADLNGGKGSAELESGSGDVTFTKS